MHKSNEKLLDISELTICYDHEIAVFDATFSIQPGQIVGLVGESGSGKTTILKAINGGLPGNSHIDRGKVIYQGQDLVKFSQKDYQKIRAKEIATVFQNSQTTLNQVRKIESQFIEYIKTHTDLNKKKAHDLAVKMLERVNLTDTDRILSAYPFELSGGMNQRVGIAMAMSLEPKLLLADEPTSALDATTQYEIMAGLKKMIEKNEMAMLLICHNLAMAYQLADYIIVLKDGRIVDQGSPKEVFNQPKHSYTQRLIEAVPRWR